MRNLESAEINSNISVSICMATYNGMQYLPEQINSIISQMNIDDELVIVDDASTDGTVSYLESINDFRIKIYRNSLNLGHVQSFSKSLSFAIGKYICMADQDDVWVKGRLDAIRSALSSGVALVSTNSIFIDGNSNIIQPIHEDLKESDSERYILNIIRIFTGKAFYDGCAMGLCKEFRKVILPIPYYVESHDLWIAMAANIFKSNRHLELRSLYRRVHGGNASVGKRSLFSKLKSRVFFLISWFHLSLRAFIRK